MKFTLLHHADQKTIDAMYTTYTPVFILTTGRSGSQFLVALLNHSLNVTAYHEPQPTLEYFSYFAAQHQDQKDVLTSMIDAARMELILQASIQDKIYISYLDPESGTSAIAAVLDRNEKMIELIYNPIELINENSAGFKLCAFYALKQGYDKNIEVYGDASTFGFANLLDEIERREWHDRFNPRFLE